MTEKTATPHKFEAQRRAVLKAMLMEATFDGWTLQALRKAGEAGGLSAAEMATGHLNLLFPKGVTDVLDFWASEADEAMAKSYFDADPAPSRIRDKVTFLVRARIDYLAPHREVSRRAAATLALPQNIALGQRLTWRTADAIWRALGDTSTDFNHYTKRTTLSAVYLSTLAKWLADEGDAEGNEPYAQTWDFLDKRIENVMQFEKFKASRPKLPGHDGLIGLLAKMRYRE